MAAEKTESFLPKVLRVEGVKVRELDYEQDLLFALDVASLDLAPLVAAIPDSLQTDERVSRSGSCR